MTEVYESLHLGVVVVYAVDHGVFVRGAATGLLDVVLNSFVEAQERVLLYTRHKLIAGGLHSGMQGDCQSELLG